MTTVPRYDDLPEKYWAYMPRGTRLLDRDLAGGGGGGLAGLPAGTTIVVRPNETGTWAGVLPERLPGAVYWWQRALTPSTNAPIPSFDDGYQDGDMVDPLADGEHLPFRGMVWSDSMATTSNVGLAGRALNNYAGGSVEGVWGSDKFVAEADGRVRVMTDVGLDIYSAGLAYVTPQPVVDNYRLRMNLHGFNNNHYGGLIVRSETTTTRSAALWCRKTATGVLTWTMVYQAPENWRPVEAIGTTPHDLWDEVAFTVRGPDMTIECGGVTLTHTLAPVVDAMPKRVIIAAGWFGNVGAKNIRFEAL